jgi:hypothetical protein
MGRAEVRECSKSSLFLMGQDAHGNWVVQEQRGMCGGLFADHATALRFAMYENGNRPQAVVMVPGIFEDNVHYWPSAQPTRRIMRGSRFSRGPSRPSDGTLAS